MRTTFIIVSHVVFVLLVFGLLKMSEAAQVTHNFSVLKELEKNGLLGTNSVDQLIHGAPANGLIHVGPMKQLHLAVIFVCSLWAVCSLMLLLMNYRRSDHQPGDEYDDQQEPGVMK